MDLSQLLDLNPDRRQPPKPWCKGYEMRCTAGHLVGKFKRDVNYHTEPLRPHMIEFEPDQLVVDERAPFKCHVCGAAIMKPPAPASTAGPEIVTDIRDSDEHASLEIICKDIADYLFQEYPGWLWAIRPSEKRGMISVYNLQLSGHYGYHIRIDDIQNDARRQAAKTGAGELLERYNQPRGPMNPERLAAIPRDFAGNPLPDLSDKSRLTKSEKIGQMMRTGDLKFYKLGSQRFARMGRGAPDPRNERLILPGKG